MARLCLIVAFFAVMAPLFYALGSMPCCNMSQPMDYSPARDCGYPSECDAPDSNDQCNGSSVFSLRWDNYCGEGTPSQFCANTPTKCTQSFLCTYDDEAMKCVGEDPLTDQNGDEVFSYENQAFAKTCKVCP